MGILLIPALFLVERNSSKLNNESVVIVVRHFTILKNYSRFIYEIIEISLKGVIW